MTYNKSMNYYKGEVPNTVCNVQPECIKGDKLVLAAYERMNLPEFNRLANRFATEPIYPAIPLVIASEQEIADALNDAYKY